MKRQQVDAYQDSSPPVDEEEKLSPVDEEGGPLVPPPVDEEGNLPAVDYGEDSPTSHPTSEEDPLAQPPIGEDGNAPRNQLSVQQENEAQAGNTQMTQETNPVFHVPMVSLYIQNAFEEARDDILEQIVPSRRIPLVDYLEERIALLEYREALFLEYWEMLLQKYREVLLLVYLEMRFLESVEERVAFLRHWAVMLLEFRDEMMSLLECWEIMLQETQEERVVLLEYWQERWRELGGSDESLSVSESGEASVPVSESGEASVPVSESGEASLSGPESREDSLLVTGNRGKSLLTPGMDSEISGKRASATSGVPCEMTVQLPKKKIGRKMKPQQSPELSDPGEPDFPDPGELLKELGSHEEVEARNRDPSVSGERSRDPEEVVLVPDEGHEDQGVVEPDAGNRGEAEGPLPEARNRDQQEIPPRPAVRDRDRQEIPPRPAARNRDEQAILPRPAAPAVRYNRQDDAARIHLLENGYCGGRNPQDREIEIELELEEGSEDEGNTRKQNLVAITYVFVFLVCLACLAVMIDVITKLEQSPRNETTATPEKNLVLNATTSTPMEASFLHALSRIPMQ